jgi:hypothetical protein
VGSGLKGMGKDYETRSIWRTKPREARHHRCRGAHPNLSKIVPNIAGEALSPAGLAMRRKPDIKKRRPETLCVSALPA